GVVAARPPPVVREERRHDSRLDRRNERSRAWRRLRRRDEHARERRRPRHLPARRPAVGDDRDRVRLGVRASADGARLPPVGQSQRPCDRGNRRVRGQHPLAEPDGGRGVCSGAGRAQVPRRVGRASRSRQRQPGDRTGARAPRLRRRPVGRGGGPHRLLRPRPGGPPPVGRRAAHLPRPRLPLLPCSRTDRKEPEMGLELTAQTGPGERLVALAEGLAQQIGGRAARHDREASFPFESFAEIKRSGYLTAPIPEELGGLGVSSLHAVLVASSRLARGDAALTLGVNMHLVFVANVVRLWRVSTASGEERRAAPLAATLEQITRDGTVFSSAVSEPRQDLTRPATTATRNGRGWIVSGHKIFCTMSPAADVLYTAVTYVDDRGSERYGYA